MIERPAHVTKELLEKRLANTLKMQAKWAGNPEYPLLLDAEIYAYRVALELMEGNNNGE